MPILPTYESKGSLTPQASGPLMSGSDPVMAATDKLNQTMGSIVEKMSNAHDVMQYTEAKGKHAIAMATLEAQASQDPDYKNSAKYLNALEKIQSTSIEGIDNQAVAAKLSQELSFDSQVTGIKIKSGFFQKELKANQTSLKLNLDSLLQKKLLAIDGGNAAEAAHYDDEIGKLIQAQVAVGTISTDEAVKYMKESQITAVKYDIYNDPSTQEGQSSVLEALRDKAAGKYSFLAPDDRLKLIEESQHRIFQNNQTFKRQNELEKTDRFNNIFAKANEGTLTLSDLDAEMEASTAGSPGSLTQKEILDIRKGLVTKIDSDIKNVTKRSEDAKKYNDFITAFIDSEPDQQKGREAIAEAYKDGILSPQEARLLNGLKAEAADIGWNRDFMENKWIPFKNAVTAVGSWIKGKAHHTDQEAALAVKALLSGVAKGENPDILIPKIQAQNRVLTQPSIKTLPPKGQRFYDPVAKVYATVFPDGHIETEKK